MAPKKDKNKSKTSETRETGSKIVTRSGRSPKDTANSNICEPDEASRDADAANIHPEVEIRNTYSVLSDDEEAIEANTQVAEGPRGQSTRKTRQPPIIIGDRSLTHKFIVDSLEPISKLKFYLDYNRYTIVLNTELMEDHENIKTKLAELKVPFYTYTDKSVKTHGFVLKGLQIDLEPEELKTILIELEIKVLNVYRMKNVKSPMYMVITDKSETIRTMPQKAKVIHYTMVKWERHDNKKGIIQCKNCQAWGHATLNCHLKPKCLKCAEEHETKNCTIKEKTDESKAKIKCANCKGGHTANSVTCPIYISKKKYLDEKKARQQKPQRVNYRDAPPPSHNAWEQRGTPTPGRSDAITATQPIPTKTSQPMRQHQPYDSAFPPIGGARYQQTGKPTTGPSILNEVNANVSVNDNFQQTPDINTLFEIGQQLKQLTTHIDLNKLLNNLKDINLMLRQDPTNKLAAIMKLLDCCNDI